MGDARGTQGSGVLPRAYGGRVPTILRAYVGKSESLPVTGEDHQIVSVNQNHLIFIALSLPSGRSGSIPS